MAHLANYLKRDLISHTRRVQNLYKRCVRNEESFVKDKYVFCLNEIKFFRFVFENILFEKQR